MSEDTKTALLALIKAAGCTDEVANTVIEAASKDGLTDMEGAGLLSAEEWTGYGVPKITAKKLVKAIVDQGKAEAAKAAAASAPAAAPTAATIATLLPEVPNDGDFLKSLQVGGIAKMQTTDVIAAVRALFASRYGLFTIDDTIMEAIAERAEGLDEQYPEIYYDLERASAKKAHAPVLLALNVPLRVVTEKRKREFLTRVGGSFTALSNFYDLLDTWQTNWMQKVSNPAMLLTALAGAMGGGAGIGGVPGLMEAPDTTPVIDAASGFIDEMNKVFRGAGIPVARALAADAIQMQELLNNPALVAATGSVSREEMIKRLGIAVTADVARAERSVVKFALGIMQLGDQPQPNLPMYCAALKELGSTIPWAKLQGESGGRPGRDPRMVGGAKGPF